MTDISHHLARLESAGLVRLAQLEPELEYLFRHALVQDATYQAMLKLDRKALHQRVGEALEHIYPDRIEELAPQLASHFDAAGDEERALRYYTRAGDSSLRRYATAEAIMMYQHAIEIAGRVQTGAEEMIHLYAGQGHAYELSARYDDALALYEGLEALGKQQGNQALVLSSLMSRATIFSTYTPHFDAPRGIELSNRALGVAEQLDDEKAQAKIHWNLLLVYRSSANAEDALVHSQKSLEIARRLKLEEQLAFTLHDSIIPNMATGKLDTALAMAEESRSMWRAMGNRAMLADNLTTSSEMVGLLGRVDESFALSQEAVEISRSIGNVWGESYALMSGAFARLYAGRLGDAVRLLEASLPLAEAAGFGYPQVLGGANLGLIMVYLGNFKRARELGESAVAAAKRLMPPAVVVGEYLLALCDALDGDFAAADIRLAENHLPTEFPDYTLLTLLASVEANIRLIEGKPDQCLARIDKALSAVPPETPPFLLNTEPLLSRARALAALGRNEEARAEFMHAIEISDKFESLYRRWDALAGLAGAEAALGNDKSAQKARKQARKALVALIATLDNPALEATFRALPEVAAVLDPK